MYFITITSSVIHWVCRFNKTRFLHSQMWGTYILPAICEKLSRDICCLYTHLPTYLSCLQYWINRWGEVLPYLDTDVNPDSIYFFRSVWNSNTFSIHCLHSKRQHKYTNARARSKIYWSIKIDSYTHKAKWEFVAQTKPLFR